MIRDVALFEPILEALTRSDVRHVVVVPPRRYSISLRSTCAPPSVAAPVLAFDARWP